MFEIATQIATPLSLGALTILVFFYLLKLVFERLNLPAVVGAHTYKILMQSITYIFLLAIVALVLGVASFILTRMIDSRQKTALESSILLLNSIDPGARATAADSLTQYAKSYHDLAARVCRELAAHVKRSSTKTVNTSLLELADDVQKAMDGISSINVQGNCPKIDLQKSDLRRLQLPHGNLSGAILVAARLDQANLLGSDLSQANLRGVNLKEAVLRNANLSGAELHQVFWRDADVRNANLCGVVGLAGADLTTVMLEGANFCETDLTGTKMPGQE